MYVLIAKWWCFIIIKLEFAISSVKSCGFITTTGVLPSGTNSVLHYGLNFKVCILH